MVVPTPDGERNALVLAAAGVAGVTARLHHRRRAGRGRARLRHRDRAAVDKIIGPGNAYVASAKRRVFGTVGIDMIAGPSEILVLADGSTTGLGGDGPVRQAEHDELAQASCCCPDAALIEAVAAAIDRLLPAQPRRDVIRASLANRGALILTRDLEEAFAISNRIAPEHLEIATANPAALLPKVRHAGAIFVGHYTSEAWATTAPGPTMCCRPRAPRASSSPLGVYDFVKRTSVIEVTASGAQVLGPVASVLARGERLTAHARSAELRLDGAAKR